MSQRAHHLPLPGAAPASKKGVAPSTFSPFVRHHLRWTERGRAGNTPAGSGSKDAGKPLSCNGIPETTTPQRRGLCPLREAEIQGVSVQLAGAI